MGDEDVFPIPAGNYSSHTNRLQAQSSGSLPTVINAVDLEILKAARSRRPLSHSDIPTALRILDGTSLLIGTSNESGFFSDSPASSSSSLYQNLTVEDRAFPEQHELDDFNKNKLGYLINDFAEELGGCWKESGRYLLMKECSVENIDADYSKVSEKAFQVLLRWKKERGSAACVLDLFKCFNHIGREDVAEKVLEYLPGRIQNACQMILLSSPKKIRCSPMTTKIHNVKEKIKEMSVEKQLRVADDEEIYLCVSTISGKKYVLIKIEERPDIFIIAARQTIPSKQLVAKKRQLRKTSDFLKEIKAKEDTVNRLKEILEQLKSKLKRDYFSFCTDNQDCTNCEKTKTKVELLEKESSLLHHTLDKILSGDRKLSVTGIPTDKIYNLAERTYGICEDHKNMHSEIKKIKRRCSQEFLDIEQKLEPEKEEEEDPEIEDTLECTMNILQHFVRRRQVVQSLTPKRRKESKAVQRNKSDKSKSRSRFYVSVRDSFRYKKSSTTQATPSGLTRTDSKKTKRSFRSKDSKIITRKKGCIEKPDLPFKPPTSTCPATLVYREGNKFLGPEDLDLDDPNEAYNHCLRAVNTAGQVQYSRGATPLYNSSKKKSTRKKVHKCNSDPSVRNGNRKESRNMGRERDSHGEAVIDILTQQYYERGRSQSDGQTRNKKTSRDQSVTKPLEKRDKLLDKSQSQFSQDSHKPSSKRRAQSFTKSQSAVLEASSDNSSEKRDKTSNGRQSHSLEDGPSVMPSKTCDQLKSQSQSSRLLSGSKCVLSDNKNNNQETTSGENVKWLRDVDTENIIFV